MLYTPASHPKDFEKMCTRGQDLINVTIFTAFSMTFLTLTVICFLLLVRRSTEQETAMKGQTTARAATMALGGPH